MPTTERYTLNDLQQATLDVMAANVMPGDDEDLTRAAMTRHEIISAVQQVPGQDEVNGNHMGPCLNCLKRRALVKEASWPAKGKFHITPAGITYVDLDGEPEPEVPRLAEKRMVEHHWPKVSPEVPREGRAEVTHIDPETRRVVLDEHERTAGDVVAPEAPSRDDPLTSMAMEMNKWPEDNREKVTPHGRVKKHMWLARREQLINKPSWNDAPEWAEWLAQDKDGDWYFYPVKPRPEGVVAGGQWIHDGAHIRAAKRAGAGFIPAGHDWRETLEARPVTQAPSAGASTTACDDQHRLEPAKQDAEIEADLLATRDVVAGMEKALEELDDARPEPADPRRTEPAPAGAPEVTILSVAVHPPGTAWLDNDATVLIKLMDEGSGPYLDISSWDGPAAIESLEMLEAVTNTARNLLREAEAREVGA